MSGTSIAFDGGDVFGKFRSVRLRICLATATAIFFVHPRNYAQSPARADVQSLQSFRSRHRDDDSCPVVNRSSAQVPGIQMSGYDYDLLRMLAPLQIGDHVVAGDVGKVLRSEGDVHAHSPLGSQMLDEFSIFGGKSRGGNSRWKTEASVWQAIVSASDGPDQRCHRAQLSCAFRAAQSIDDRFTISVKCHPGDGFKFIVRNIEQNNLARDLFPAERRQFVEVVDNDHIGGDAFGWSGGTAADCRKNDTLRRFGHLARIFDELSFFFAANPVRDRCRFETDRKAKLPHFSRNVFCRGLCLRRSRRTRSDVLR